MRQQVRSSRAERGTILLVVVFIATAIAGLAAISAERVLTENRRQQSLEDESRAVSSAYAQIHMAMSVVNTAVYDEFMRNPELRSAVAGDYGGTASDRNALLSTEAPPAPGGEESGYVETDEMGEPEDVVEWLKDPEGSIEYGFIRGTNVRVYHARDYLLRLARLKDPDGAKEDPDPFSQSDGYFVLEAAGRSGATVRLVSALIRETQPFSSYVFFQNRATLGISGSPKGMIHCNQDIAFYFPGGDYRDSVAAVGGFDYLAGASADNTYTRNANPNAGEIVLEDVDFDALRAEADPDNPDAEFGAFAGPAGLDADIHFKKNGMVDIKLYTPPTFEKVTKTRTVASGQEQVEVPTYEWVDDLSRNPYKVQVFDHWDYKGGWVDVKIGTEPETYWATEPVYELQTVTKYRSEQVWVPYNQTDAGGGTTVAGGGSGELGEWQTIQVPYETEEQVQVGTTQVEKTRQVAVYERQWKDDAKKVAVYRTEERYYQIKVETGTKMVWQTVYTEEEYEVEAYVPPHLVGNETLTLGMSAESGGTQLTEAVVYIDGRIRGVSGDLFGRLTLVSGESVRIAGDIQYVDNTGETAMLNGKNYNEEYLPNPDYWADFVEANKVKPAPSALGVISKDDVLLTRQMPSTAEVNATLMSVDGRVGIDGFWADDTTGELYPDSWRSRRDLLTPEERAEQRAYDRDGYTKSTRFAYNSLRRMGGIISNNRVMETYVTADKKSGTSKVSAGFKRGSMMYDMNLSSHPPPHFVEIPRPEVRNFMPVYLAREGE